MESEIRGGPSVQLNFFKNPWDEREPVKNYLADFFCFGEFEGIFRNIFELR